VKRKLIAAIGIAGMMASIAACGGSDDDASKQDPKDRKGELTVWLMVDAQSSWPELVKQANTEFNKKYPGVKVNVQYQQWGDKTKKLDAALSGDSFPDVVELGNTETMTYILNGALGEIDAKKYDNSDTWIEGLKDTCSYEGKLYCVPYYAGARVAVYNKDMFKAATGSDTFPATETVLTGALGKVQAKYGAKDRAFSPLYLPGRYWYAAMSYVAAYGGQIATYDKDTKEWRGALSSPRSQQGIQHFADLVRQYNHGDKTKDEADHANVMANEKAGVIYGNAWEATNVVDTAANGNARLKDKIGIAAMPGPNGKTLPSFIGGSDLATVAKSGQQDLAEYWISLFTNEESEAGLAAKNILPNNTKQLEPLKDNPETAAVAGAVPNAWFTPIAPGWAAIEKKETIELMLLDIIKGEPVASATKAADAEIDKMINESS
jgi:N,N'-diacetylchitobiose transport system substrate-binding protein